jgi:hypothetical protein
MSEPNDLEHGIFPDRDKIPDLEAAEDQGNLMGDDEDPDYSGNPPTEDDTDRLHEEPSDDERER